MKAMTRQPGNRSQRRRFASFRRNSNGATAVEFAMLAPVFFCLLGLLFETGVMMFTEYTIQTSVQEAARLVRTGQAQSEGLTASAFKAKVCNIAKLVIDCENKVTVHMEAATDFATLAASVPDYLTIGPKLTEEDPPPPFDCGDPSQPVALIATYDWTFTMLGMRFFSNMPRNETRRLAAFAMFKNEPFPAVTGGCQPDPT
jgi:Flp pilus assembly protein TadG